MDSRLTVKTEPSLVCLHPHGSVVLGVQGNNTGEVTMQLSRLGELKISLI